MPDREELLVRLRCSEGVAEPLLVERWVLRKREKSFLSDMLLLLLCALFEGEEEGEGWKEEDFSYDISPVFREYLSVKNKSHVIINGSQFSSKVVG